MAPLHSFTLPERLALVDDDSEYTEYLSQYLQGQGVGVNAFADSDDLLTRDDPYAHDFYLVDLMMPGIDGIDLIKLLRRRSDAGIVVISGRLAPDVFERSITAGADMYLAKPVQFEQVMLAIKAVQRRAARTPQARATWVLDRQARQLLAPDGNRVDLSDVDLQVMDCFVKAGGEVVTREQLQQRLGRQAETDATDSLNATIYRLRRRIERATPQVVPLQSKSRVGYRFKAPLQER
jgi:DNA-binding response OmpR family regulator